LCLAGPGRREEGPGLQRHRPYAPAGAERAGQWSERINDQWRLCFVWTDAGPGEVELVDYH